jgi:hypothetical protein
MSLYSVNVLRGSFLHLLQLICRVAFFSFTLDAGAQHQIVFAEHLLTVDHLALIATGLQPRVRVRRWFNKGKTMTVRRRRWRRSFSCTRNKRRRTCKYEETVDVSHLMNSPHCVTVPQDNSPVLSLTACAVAI